MQIRKFPGKGAMNSRVCVSTNEYSLTAQKRGDKIICTFFRANEYGEFQMAKLNNQNLAVYNTIKAVAEQELLSM